MLFWGASHRYHIHLTAKAITLLTNWKNLGAILTDVVPFTNNAYFVFSPLKHKVFSAPGDTEQSQMKLL